MMKAKMMNRGMKRLFKKKSQESLENVVCKNCETQFSGKYCPECGQSVREYDRPVSFIFYNFVGDFFAFDTRFFRTFAALLIKPGFLTKEYFDGKRVKYAPPFRIFIFASFILFLLLQTYTNKGLTTVLDSDFKDGELGIDSTSLALTDSILTEVNDEIDASVTSESDSILNSIGINLDSISDEKLNFSVNMDTFRDTRDLRTALNKFALGLEKKLEDETDPKKKAKMREYIRLCRSPEQAVAKILEQTSWAFFILLPLFALILKLVYIRRKQNYMRHLIFSIHMHSYIFIVMILVVAFYMIFKGNVDVPTALLIFTLPVYFIIALRRFYGQSWGKVILKFFVISFLYNMVYATVLGFTTLNALSII